MSCFVHRCPVEDRRQPPVEAIDDLRGGSREEVTGARNDHELASAGQGMIPPKLLPSGVPMVDERGAFVLDYDLATPMMLVKLFPSGMLGLGLTALPAQVLAEDALDIALKHRTTAYDACYVAAASQLRLPLITADEKLAAQLAKGSYEVQWLGDVKPVYP